MSDHRPDILKAFEEAIDRNELRSMVDNIKLTSWGISYDWDGKLTCHIVQTWTNRYFDVQDKNPQDLPDTILSDYQDYGTVSELVDYIVLNMYPGTTEWELVYRTRGIGGAWIAARDQKGADFDALAKDKTLLEKHYAPGTEYRIIPKLKSRVLPKPFALSASEANTLAHLMDVIERLDPEEEDLLQRLRQHADLG